MQFSEDNCSISFQKPDLSRKGSIDSRIVELVNFINLQRCYKTTSSCSGRTIIFTNTETKKKGCCWIFVSHDIVSSDAIEDALNNHSGSAILKFEPFVLHTQCSTLEDAKTLLKFGIESGFKNSGISIGKAGKIIVAIRSTLSLEIPLSKDGILLVSKEYISFITSICNEKIKDNWQRIDRFYTALQKINNPPVIKTKFKKLYEKEFNQLHKKEITKESESIEDCVNCFDAISDFQSLINDIED